LLVTYMIFISNDARSHEHKIKKKRERGSKGKVILFNDNINCWDYTLSMVH